MCTKLSKMTHVQYIIQRINKLHGKYYYYRDSESDRIAQLKREIFMQ